LLDPLPLVDDGLTELQVLRLLDEEVQIEQLEGGFGDLVGVGDYDVAALL
jgi:hypothetical protein